MLSSQTPSLVMRPGPIGRHGFSWPVEVADFSEEKRPAFRVACHCRNCSWKGEARIEVGNKIPQWLRCPKCEVIELSAHGEFLGRDEMTREEEKALHIQAQDKYDEMRKRDDEIRKAAEEEWNRADQKKIKPGLLRR